MLFNYNLKNSFYITKRERFNAYSHIFASLFFLIIGLYANYLCIRSNHYNLLPATLIYSFGIFFVYAASALYHSAEEKVVKTEARILDHCGLFISFAATYTPILIILFHETWTTIICILLWILAAIGVFYEFQLGKTHYTMGRKQPLNVMLMMCVLLLLILPKIILTTTVFTFSIYLLGIIFSFIGGYYYVKSKKVPEKDAFYHGVWHVLGFLSSLLLYIFYYLIIYRYL